MPPGVPPLYFRVSNSDDARKVTSRQHVLLVLQPMATARYSPPAPPTTVSSTTANNANNSFVSANSSMTSAATLPPTSPSPPPPPIVTTSSTSGGVSIKFAVGHSLARQCRVLAEILNTNDLHPPSDGEEDDEQDEQGKRDKVRNDPFDEVDSTTTTTTAKTKRRGRVPEIVVPGIDPETFESVLSYLSLTLTRIPTVLGRPLHAPLEHLLHPWELEFLYAHCLVNRDIFQHAPLLKICRVADFLVIDSLRDLSCAFLASLVMSQKSEEELVKFFGLPRAYTEDDFEDLFRKFPFLRVVPPSSPLMMK